MASRRLPKPDASVREIDLLDTVALERDRVAVQRHEHQARGVEGRDHRLVPRVEDVAVDHADLVLERFERKAGEQQDCESDRE